MEHTTESAGALNSGNTGRAAVSWPAIVAGAAVAASISLVLLTLGSGLGFASVSPWQGHGATVTTFAVSTAIWLIVMQWLSSGVGGYIAGRLRTRWPGTHVHEVFFRDTAHGFVTWAVSTVLVAAVLATVAASAIGLGGRAASAVAVGAARGAQSATASTGGGFESSDAYRLDRLFRSAGPGAGGGGSGDPRPEADHIVANAMATGNVPEADRGYLADVVAARAGIPQADAQKRVAEFIEAATAADLKTKTQADAARKAAAQAAIYTALSMLVGAFIASVAAALGGRLRDEHA
jgi:hypothetical protein